MLRVKDGDLAQLGVLFDRYSPRLYSFFVRHTGRRDVSEDRRLSQLTKLCLALPETARELMGRHARLQRPR